MSRKWQENFMEVEVQVELRRHSRWLSLYSFLFTKRKTSRANDSIHKLPNKLDDNIPKLENTDITIEHVEEMVRNIMEVKVQVEVPQNIGRIFCSAMERKLLCWEALY